MWELDHKEGWAVKNWCFQIVVLRRHLRVPWTGRRSNQSILKEISPEYSLEGLMLKLQYFVHLMWRAYSLEKTLMLGKTEGLKGEGVGRGWDGWMESLTPRVHPNPRPSSRWCHPTISSSVISFSSCPQLSQHQGLFKWVSSSHQVVKVLEFQPQHQSLQWRPRTDLL